MVNERYLVLNRHRTSIIDIFYRSRVLDSRFSLRARTHFSPIKLTIQNTVPGLRLDKSIKIVENIRITISKDHNSQDSLSINHFIHNEACIRTYEPPCNMHFNTFKMCPNVSLSCRMPSIYMVSLE